MATEKELAKLVVKLEAQSERLVKELQKSRNEVTKFKNHVQKSTTAAAAAFKRVQTSIVSLVGIYGLVRVTKAAIEVGDQIQKMSLRLGQSADEISRMKFVAERGGSSLEGYGKIMQRLQKSASDASVGLTTAVRGFNQLGISFRDFQKLTPQEQFDAFAEGIGKLKNQSDKMRVAMDLGGRAAGEFLSVIANGKEDLDKLREGADLLNITLSQTDANKFADVADAFTNVKDSAFGTAQVLVSQLGPALVAVANELTLGISSAADSAKYTFLKLESYFLDAASTYYKFGATIEHLRSKISFTEAGRKEAAKNERELLKKQLDVQLKSAEIADKIIAISERTEKRRQFIFSEGNKIKPIEIPNTSSSGDVGKRKDEYQSLVDSMRSQEEVLADSYARRAQIIQNARDDNIIGDEKMNALLVYQQAILMNDLAKVRKNGLTDLQKFNEMSWRDQASTVSKELLNMTNDVAQQNKVLFNINKIANISEAIINAHAAASKALAAYPPPLSFTMASIAYAAGIARVLAIKNTKFGGGATSGGGAVASPTTSPTPVFQASPNTGLPTESRGTTVINIPNDSLYSPGFMSELLDQIAMASDRNDQIIIRKSSRNAIDLAS